jgi:hypothetical protein
VNNQKRKIFFSGKEKKHNIKNQLTVNKGCFIIHKATHKKGRKHDYKFIFTQEIFLSFQKRSLVYLILDILL